MKKLITLVLLTTVLSTQIHAVPFFFKTLVHGAAMLSSVGGVTLGKVYRKQITKAAVVKSEAAVTALDNHARKLGKHLEKFDGVNFCNETKRLLHIAMNGASTALPAFNGGMGKTLALTDIATILFGTLSQDSRCKDFMTKYVESNNSKIRKMRSLQADVQNANLNPILDTNLKANTVVDEYATIVKNFI